MQTSQNILPAKSNQHKQQPKIYLIKKAKKANGLVVLLTNQKDYGHYLARASGHYNLRKSPQFYISIFDFFRNTRYASQFTLS